MTIDDFDYGMERIVDTFGDKSYSSGRKMIMFRQFSFYSREVFLNACDYLVATERYSPLVPQFKEALLFVKTRTSGMEMFRSECKECDTFGSILIARENIQYAYQCVSCDAGVKNYGGLPRFR